MTCTKEQIVQMLNVPVEGHNIRIPRDLDVEIKNGELKICVNSPHHNMQTNEAAFEGWILALRIWLGDDFVEVELAWVKSELGLYEWQQNVKELELREINERLHYNRFLYRILVFRQMFDWFRIAPQNQDEIQEFEEWLKQQRLVLNEPTKAATDKSSLLKGLTSTDITEDVIEARFADPNQPLLKNKFGVTKVGRQLPVGVFRKEKAKVNAVFTYSKSAIDLWGVNPDTAELFIFEIKFNNQPIGIISELIFYLAIMNERYGKTDGLIGKQTNTKTAEDDRGIGFLDQQALWSICGVFLTDGLHPLIDGKVIKLLNTGLKRLGAVSVQNQYFKWSDGEPSLTN